MNSQDIKNMVSYRFSKAKETLADVDVLIQNRLWNIAVNRLYYSCFYAVIALCAANNIFTKTHDGAKRMFGLHFVKTGIISKAANAFYGEIFNKRQQGDYEDYIDYSESDVLILIEPAKKFIAEIEKLLMNPQT